MKKNRLMELAGLYENLTVSKASLERELGDAVVGEDEMSAGPGPGITVVLGDYESDDMSLIDMASGIEKDYPMGDDIDYATARGDDAPNAITLRIGSTIDKGLLDALKDINA
tara:strand:- start:627 stop:962 length:336 start_codon:yes stop_codon:yes gene_type:complete